MTFNVGEKVVYPNHGVATVENISTRSFGVRFERFYLLRLSCNNMTVMVPFSHVDDVGITQSDENGEIARVLAISPPATADPCRIGRTDIRKIAKRCGAAVSSRSPRF